MQQLDIVCLENVLSLRWKYTYKLLVHGDIIGDDIDKLADDSVLTTTQRLTTQTKYHHRSYEIILPYNDGLTAK